MRTVTEPRTEAKRGSILVLLVGMAIAGVAGYLIGRSQSTRAGVVPAANAPLAKADRARTAAAPSAQTPSSERNEAAAARDWDSRWRELATAARTPKLARDMADMLAQLAEHEHEQAMKIALAEPNLKTRAELRNAVLRGWAKTEPNAAAEWALALGRDDRIDALQEVLSGAVEHPAEAAKVGAVVCERDPDHAFDYSESLVRALAGRGEFEMAAQFVTSRPATPQRVEETEHAFTTWAQSRPSEALAAIDKITDREAHDAAFRGVVIGWSQADPVALTEYAIQLPPGENRGIALANGLPRWVEHDPVAAGTWLSQREPSPDLDMGVVAVATVPGIVMQKPALAVSLAQTISDPTLRANTLYQVALRWSETDLAAATHFVETSSQFGPAQKEALLAQIKAERAR